jgi:hypothetical protein
MCSKYAKLPGQERGANGRCRNLRVKSADLKSMGFQEVVTLCRCQPLDIMRESAFSSTHGLRTAPRPKPYRPVSQTRMTPFFWIAARYRRRIPDAQDHQPNDYPPDGIFYRWEDVRYYFVDETGAYDDGPP